MKNKSLILITVFCFLVIGGFLAFYFLLGGKSIVKKEVKGNMDFRSPEQAENIIFNSQGANLNQNNGLYVGSGTLTLKPFSVNNPNTNWQVLYIKATILNSDSIKIKIRTGSTLEDLAANYFDAQPINWSSGRSDFTLNTEFQIGAARIFKTSKFIQLQIVLNSSNPSKTPVLNDLSLYYHFLEPAAADQLSEMVVNCKKDPNFTLQNRWQDAGNRGKFYPLGQTYKISLSDFELHIVYDINEYMRFVRDFLNNPIELAKFKEKFPNFTHKSPIANPATSNEAITWEETFAYCYWRGMLPVPQAHAEYYRQKVLANDTNSCRVEDSDMTILPFWEMPIWIADAYNVSFKRIGEEIKTFLPNLPITRDPITTIMGGPTRCFRDKQDGNGDIISDWQTDKPNATKYPTLQPLVCVKFINNCSSCNQLSDLRFNDYYAPDRFCARFN